MDLFQSVVLGIVEGLTEFLPVSSTFHLILTSRLLGITESDFLKMFEVVIQFGAVSSLLFLYTKTLLKNHRLIILLLASFIPTAIVGKLLYPVIKTVFFTNTFLQLAVMVVVSILFLIVEHLIKSGRLKISRTVADLTLSQAAIIGLAQSTSVVPGVSRSGSIILASLFLSLTRTQAAEYAFLLSLPTILAASVFDLYENRVLLITLGQSALLPLVLGFISAFISAYFVVKWFIKYVSAHSLKPFAYYRLILVLVLLLLRVGLSR